MAEQKVIDLIVNLFIAQEIHENNISEVSDGILKDVLLKSIIQKSKHFKTISDQLDLKNNPADILNKIAQPLKENRRYSWKHADDRSKNDLWFNSFNAQVRLLESCTDILKVVSVDSQFYQTISRTIEETEQTLTYLQIFMNDKKRLSTQIGSRKMQEVA